VAGIRTVMVTTPVFLADMINRLAIGRIELDLVGRLSGRRGLAKRLQQLAPDLVIIGLRDDETDTFIRSLLLALPNSKMIAILADGRSMAGYELRVRRVALSDLSPAALVDFIERSIPSGRG
jgi:AmiR/NasT family two-component response regulator